MASSSSSTLLEESSATNAAVLPNLSRLLASASPVVALRSTDRSFELADVWYEGQKTERETQRAGCNSSDGRTKTRTSFERNLSRSAKALDLLLKKTRSLLYTRAPTPKNRTAFDLWSAFGLEVPLSLGGEGEVRRRVG